VFEVSRRSLGRVGMCWSQLARVDHLHKKWRVGRKKNSRKMGTVPQVQASTRNQRATIGRRSALGRRPVNSDLWLPMGRRPRAGQRPAIARRPRVNTCTCGIVHIFLKFFNLKEMNFWKFGRWARAFGRMGVQHPHF
jgi:hypothetical protein